MTDVSTFQPLVSDYPRVSDDDRYELEPGQVFEHYWFDLDNGYSVSVARTNLEPESLGFQNGNWEAAIGIRNPILTALFGVHMAPAPEIPGIETEEVQGMQIIGDLDNDAVNALVAKVASLPSHSDAMLDDDEESQNQ